MPTSFQATPIEIDVVAFQDESGTWIAQCIQYDIAVHAKSFPKLLKAMEKQVVANICINEKLGRKGLEGIPPAPDKFRNRFNEAEIRLAPEPRADRASSPVEVHNVAVLEMA